MGSVFRAVQTSLGRPVAIKFMHGELGADPDFRRRFLDEGQLTARLDHPSVVRVYEYGMDGETPYLVYEFIEGEDLRSRLGRPPPVGREQALDWMLQVLDGLAAAHELGIIHRDVKPENILLGAEGRVVLADFGLARETGADSRTAGGLVLGTPAYVAPEQILGQRATPGTDVYSAAAVLYELLCGRPPIDAATPGEVLARKVKEDPPSPSARVAGIPSNLSKVVLTALSREPSVRFAGAREFRKALEAARRVPVVEPPAGATRAVRTSARREAATVVSAAAVPVPRKVAAARSSAVWPGWVALAAVLGFGFGFTAGQWRADSRVGGSPGARVSGAGGDPSDSAPGERSPAGPGAMASAPPVSGQASVEPLMADARQALELPRIEKAIAVHYPLLGRKGPDVQVMRAFWDAAGGAPLASRVAALVPRVRAVLSDSAIPARDRSRLYALFEPLARLDGVLDFYGASTLFGWSELAAGAAATEPCADLPERSSWQPVQTWPEMEQALVCKNLQVIQGERDFWSMLLGLSWLRREPVRQLEFDYRRPAWWTARPVEWLTRATFLLGEAILRVSFTPLPGPGGSPSAGEGAPPDLELFVRPCHRRYSHVGTAGATREDLRADATGCLTRIAPGLLEGNRDYRIRVRILAGPTPAYRHKMLVLGFWMRQPRSEGPTR